MKKKVSSSLIVATWFKTGLIRPVLFRGMAGTYGSFFAIPLCIIAILYARMFSRVGGGFWMMIAAYGCILLMVLVLGLLTVRDAEIELGPRPTYKKDEVKTRDQNQIVIDEVLGMIVSCIPLLFTKEYGVKHFLIAFALFRVFDIWKVFPTKIFDRMKNPFGVMMDDVVAGIYAALSVQILISYHVI